MKFEEEEFICVDEEQEKKREEEEFESKRIKNNFYLVLIKLFSCLATMGTYPINGIKVKFPFKPYPSQIGMMDRVIRALDGNKQHALLESPTGSGKTMALLCGVLSWIEEQKKKHNIENQGPTTLLPEGASPDVIDESENLPSFFDKKIKKEVFVVEDEMDLDFVDSKKISKSDCSNCPNSSVKSKSFDDESKNLFEGNGKFEMPKVYFASRTHKQLAQCIRELKRSGYQAKFTVLASRRQYCVNSQVKSQPDINEAWYQNIKCSRFLIYYLVKKL